jgi:hypothetical protein
MSDVTKALENDDWPALTEELTRKGAQALEKWLAKHDEGKITDRELYIVVDALWDTMSGLCERAFLRTLEAIHQELRTKNGKRKRS